MKNEKYWEMALEKTRISIKENSLFPLKTQDITKDIYGKNDFLIRRLDTTKFKSKFSFGPKINPFRPWEKILEIGKIGNNHHLILNKYPVQLGHLLLITNEWKPQDGWLDINDWKAIQHVNIDTTGLWFFNSGPLAGASQPHRHIQLLRRASGEIICPREDWLISCKGDKKIENKLESNIIVYDINFENEPEILYGLYLRMCNDLSIGNPFKDQKPKKPYNLLITNQWIAIIKRSSDHHLGYSINGLGFAGYILVTNRSDISFIREKGPEKLLESFV